MEIMIDLETFGTKTNCPVISIGAVAFDLTNIYSDFYTTLNLQEQLDSKTRVLDIDTVKWWMEQSEAAKKVFKEKEVSVKTALQGLTDFINLYEEAYVWGNGSCFDISILESLYSDFKMPVPWKYNKVMDFRTIKRFMGKDKEIDRSGGIYHNALGDARCQAIFIQNCLQDFHKKI